jgi:hypothetical protein
MLPRKRTLRVSESGSLFEALGRTVSPVAYDLHHQKHPPKRNSSIIIITFIIYFAFNNANTSDQLSQCTTRESKRYVKGRNVKQEVIDDIHSVQI